MSKTKQNKTKKEEEDKKKWKKPIMLLWQCKAHGENGDTRFQNIDFSIHKIKAGAVGWENVTETQAE